MAEDKAVCTSWFQNKVLSKCMQEFEDADALRSTVPPVVIEFCCDMDSNIGIEGERKGVKVIRLGIGSQLQTKKGFDLARKHVEDNPGCDVWASIPCKFLVHGKP